MSDETTFNDVIKTYIDISDNKINEIINKDKDYWYEFFNYYYQKKISILNQKNFLSTNEEYQLSVYITDIFKQKKLLMIDYNNEQKNTFAILLSKKLSQYDKNSGHPDSNKINKKTTNIIDNNKNISQKNISSSIKIDSNTSCVDVINSYKNAYNNTYDVYSDMDKINVCNLSSKDTKFTSNCYGARFVNNCYTCSDVVKLYKSMKWGYDIENFDQCKLTKNMVTSKKNLINNYDNTLNDSIPNKNIIQNDILIKKQEFIIFDFIIIIIIINWIIGGFILAYLIVSHYNDKRLLISTLLFGAYGYFIYTRNI